MNSKLYITGVAATLALVAMIVALVVAAPNASAPERAEVFNDGGAARLVQTSATFAPSEPNDVCGMPGANPGNCSY